MRGQWLGKEDKLMEYEPVRYCGMIYLSWTWQDHEAASASDVRLLGRLWRAYAAEKVEQVLRMSLLTSTPQWMNDDLFVSIDLPPGNKGELEEWMLEHTYGMMRHWESEFHQYASSMTDTAHRGKLLVGISVVAKDASLGKLNLWYEASKAAILHGQSPGSMEHSLRRKAFHRLLTQQDGLYPVYQPIVSLSGGLIFGYEALTRLNDRSWFDGPLPLFHFADAEGQLYALERIARERAIGGCFGLARRQKLFINVNAQIMESPEFLPGQTMSLLEEQQLDPQHVVFEITERSAIRDFNAFKRVMEHYRNQGYQIAIDDVGAGYSSLQSIVELRPDYLKVDRSIIHNVHEDEMKRHILQTLQDIACKMGVSVIAEGIEQEAELQLLREVGVHYAQGYLLGRPRPFFN
ncbi:EAL domain-containing protein [Paenibacillus sp. J5C_2022]|uniref:EAL domain-containing protein n=1 Tax=Paenibacillus sp. J5C2022 TaxID=2977129 RepID=UPI0021D02416|nr:EAL domain-containing protein [Paenibacillus sp. J5C2022]MCU6710467.1 EAL domain-containing protein [Paenibacillus sp. J5C2022]